MLKRIFKLALKSASLLAVFLPAAASAFGKWDGLYTFFAQFYALVPGVPGDYLRIAFYRFTLAKCDLSGRVSFGSFFAHPEAELGPHAYIGPYCVIGKAVIGGHVQIASAVQILSGRRQHVRNESGEILGSEEGIFRLVTIGDHCWIGAASIVMADVGAGSTVGAGSVVSRPIPSKSVAVGNPARVIKSAPDAIAPDSIDRTQAAQP